jgi:dihydroorotase-like cyclic amidohydrolase
LSDLWKAIEADASSFDDITTEGGAQLSELVRGTSEVIAEIVTAEEGGGRGQQGFFADICVWDDA